MRLTVLTAAMAVLLAGCGGGSEHGVVALDSHPAPAAGNTGQQPSDKTQPQQPPVVQATPPIQHEPIMKTKQTADAKIVKTEAEWRAQLTPEEYRILRLKGTERAFTGKYDHHFKNGTYTCKGCDTPLFLSETKYNSGCGWPAFYESIKGTIDTVRDTSHGMDRIEITCKKCGGHLGHVFDDGPNPTGLRYCVNSASMEFIPTDKQTEKPQ